MRSVELRMGWPAFWVAVLPAAFLFTTLLEAPAGCFLAAAIFLVDAAAGFVVVAAVYLLVRAAAAFPLVAATTFFVLLAAASFVVAAATLAARLVGRVDGMP